MKLSVPFLPDTSYTEFLAGQQPFLASIYFPLYAGPAVDARVQPGYSAALGATAKAGDPAFWADTLSSLAKVEKYILFNTRFVTPDLYADTRSLVRMLDWIAALHKSAEITGLVITDAFLLNSLAGTGHDIITVLEAVPGVNTMLDTLEKVWAWMDIIQASGFKPPGRLILDRSLNRTPKALSSLSCCIKTYWPGIRIELLANEGCIWHCPFKPAHDAQIALSNTGLVREATWQISRTAGCHAYFLRHPQAFFKSPFIRPEDTDQYTETADVIKLGGRTLGPGFLKNCITAYINRSYEGNLLDLMDATRFMADHYFVDNKAMDPGFFHRITSCTKICKPCNICQTLFDNCVKKRSKTLRPYKDIQ